MAEQIKDTKTLPELTQVIIKEHQEFNDVIATATLTSYQLEEKIAELFASTFVDFEGCKIMPIGDQLKCKLYFKPDFNKGEGLYAVKVKGENIAPNKKRVNFAEFVNTVNMMSSAKQFELEPIAKDILAEFLVLRPTDVKVEARMNTELGKEVNIRLPKNWNAYTEEINDVVAGTRFQTPYLAVSLDLIPIVAKMYGKKDPDEVEALAGRGIIPRDRYQYAVNIVKVLDANMNKFILEIRRIDIKVMNDLSQSIGFGMVTGNIVMTRK